MSLPAQTVVPFLFLQVLGKGQYGFAAQSLGMSGLRHVQSHSLSVL